MNLFLGRGESNEGSYGKFHNYFKLLSYSQIVFLIIHFEQAIINDLEFKNF